jgi:hypothetical protein
MLLLLILQVRRDKHIKAVTCLAQSVHFLSCLPAALTKLFSSLAFCSLFLDFHLTHPFLPSLFPFPLPFPPHFFSFHFVPSPFSFPFPFPFPSLPFLPLFLPFFCPSSLFLLSVPTYRINLCYGTNVNYITMRDIFYLLSFSSF